MCILTKVLSLLCLAIIVCILLGCASCAADHRLVHETFVENHRDSSPTLQSTPATSATHLHHTTSIQANQRPPYHPSSHAGHTHHHGYGSSPVQTSPNAGRYTARHMHPKHYYSSSLRTTHVDHQSTTHAEPEHHRADSKPGKHSPAQPSNTDPPYSHHITSTGHHAYPVHYAHEHDGVEDAWDTIDRTNKHQNEKDRVERFVSYGKSVPPAVVEVDAENAYGFVLKQRRDGEMDRHNDPLRDHSKLNELSESGHCNTSDVVWSTLQYSPPNCPSSSSPPVPPNKPTMPTHLADVHASVHDDFSVGTILPAFTHTVHYQ